MKDIEAQSENINLEKHINSIKETWMNKQIYYNLALVPSSKQIKVIQEINEKKLLEDDTLNQYYYCQEQKISPFLGCFSYKKITLNQVQIQIQLIIEKLVKACTLVFFTSVIPFVYPLIAIYFLQFIVILVSKFLISNWLSSQDIIFKVKMKVIMLSWIVVSLLVLSILLNYILEEKKSNDKNTLYRLLSILPFQVWVLLYQFYWINYYEKYLANIASQYKKEEQTHLYKNKLLIDFYLLQKHFKCHLNSHQKFYLLRKNLNCKISDISLQFAILNAPECEKFFNQENKADNDIENQPRDRLSKSERIRNRFITNAMLDEIKDQLASSQALNQKELANIIEINKLKKIQDNPTMLPPLLSHRSSIYSNFPLTPQCYSPTTNTKSLYLLADNIQTIGLNCEINTCKEEQNVQDQDLQTQQQQKITNV